MFVLFQKTLRIVQSPTYKRRFYSSSGKELRQDSPLVPYLINYTNNINNLNECAELVISSCDAPLSSPIRSEYSTLMSEQSEEIPVLRITTGMVPDWDTKYYEIMTGLLLKKDDPLVMADEQYMLPPPYHTTQIIQNRTPHTIRVVIEDSLDNLASESAG